MSTTFYNSQNLVGIGSVGIGTTSPLSSLHVLGGITGTYGATFIRCANGSGGALTSSNVISIGYNGSKDFLNLHVPGNSGASDTLPGITMLATSSSAVPNIGIGTTSPGNILSVGGGGRLRIANGNSDYTLIGTNDMDGITNSRLVISGINRGTNAGGIEYVSCTTATGTQGDHLFYRATTTEAMRISGTNGNVGIGAASPTAPLQVTPLSGASTPANNGVLVHNPNNLAQNSAIVAVRLAGTTAASAFYSYDVSGVAGYSHGITGASQNLVFRAAWDFSSSTIFTMDRLGNFTASADITAYSDRRIKTDIKKIEGALDKVSRIGGYTFTRTDDSCMGQRQAGVIAQELLEVLPEVVRVNEETGYYTVSYGNITALLIEALKEEKAKREALEARIAALELRP
jgi:hypothetical protein